jgi:hypothetical protein
MRCDIIIDNNTKGNQLSAEDVGSLALLMELLWLKRRK